ncbi:MAG: hypothetical protein SH850_26385 [Planctomycetaceae bacterium]|nr:hypothetical protein [Planctomycetaceae bacterium]
MPQIVVDEQSARIIEESPIVEVRDLSGRLVGFIAKDLVEDFEIAKARRARGGPTFTTEEMWKRIHLGDEQA